MEAFSAITRSFIPLLEKSKFFFDKRVTTVAFSTLGAGFLVKGALGARRYFLLRSALTQGHPGKGFLRQVNEIGTQTDILDKPKDGFEYPLAIIKLLDKDLLPEGPMTKQIRDALGDLQIIAQKTTVSSIKKDKGDKQAISLLKELVSPGRYGIHKSVIFSVLGVGFLICAAYSYRYVKALPLPKLARQ